MPYIQANGGVLWVPNDPLEIQKANSEMQAAQENAATNQQNAMTQQQNATTLEMQRKQNVVQDKVKNVMDLYKVNPEAAVNGWNADADLNKMTGGPITYHPENNTIQRPNGEIGSITYGPDGTPAYKMVAPAPMTPKVGAVNPDKFTPESLAKFNTSGNYADLVMNPTSESGTPSQEKDLQQQADAAVKRGEITQDQVPAFKEKLRLSHQTTVARAGAEARAEGTYTGQEQAAAGSPRLARLADYAYETGGLDPKDFSAFRNNRQQLLDALISRHPDVNVVKMEKNIAYMGDPVLNRSVVFANTVLPRLEVLKKQMANLQPGQFKDMNALRNWILLHTGDTRIVDVLTNRNSSVLEAVRAMTGSAVQNELRTRLELQNMDIAYSGPQFVHGIENVQLALRALQTARNTLPYPDWKNNTATETKPGSVPAPTTGSVDLKKKYGLQ